MKRFVMALCVVAAAGAFAQDAGVISVKGTWNYGPKDTGTWSAKLTPKGDGSYEAAYVAIRAGKELKYTGTVKTDLKTAISGDGKRGNESFEFSGTYGPDGIAKCTYKENGGYKRTGPLTAEMPR